MKEEFLRKLFHLLALGYVAGALWLPRRTFLAVVLLLLVLDFTFENLRFRVPAFRAWFLKSFGTLIRPGEREKFTAVFWMLLGVLTAALLVQPTPVLVTIYLFVIFGDGVASLVGKGIGGPKWPGSQKSLSGSSACFIVCLLCAALVLRPGYSWVGIVAASAAATLLEFGILPWNDNLAIPLGTALVFLLIYRLPLVLP
jgi:dolichol kinase